jgi:hypothetical protein
MNYIKLIVFSIIVLNCGNLFSQTDNQRKIMFVAVREGAVARESSNINSREIATLLFGQRIVVDEQGPRATINGITGYWYKIDRWYCHSRKTVYSNFWIFGGYLSEELPLDAPVILGRWYYVSESGWAYTFDPDGGYTGGRDHSTEFVRGVWNLNGNVITITFDEDYIEEGGIKTVTGILTEINRNNIILEFPNDRVEFRRYTQSQMIEGYIH